MRSGEGAREGKWEREAVGGGGGRGEAGVAPTASQICYII